MRPPKVEPATRNFDKTPKKPANNDPTKTSRGRAALRKRIRDNKKNSSKFEEAIKFITKIMDYESTNGQEMPGDKVYEMVSELKDPVNAHRLVGEVAKSPKKASFWSGVQNTIRNVCEVKQFCLPISVCEAGDKDSELRVFEEAKEKANNLKNIGSPLAWIERTVRSNIATYRVQSDIAPSELYVERRADPNVHILTSDADKSNIIQILYGD